jgi:hypothetical protein
MKIKTNDLIFETLAPDHRLILVEAQTQAQTDLEVDK